MARVRLLILITTIIVVSVVGVIVSYYARGYRLDPDTLEFSPNGLLVIKSVPDGAQILVDGELKTATNANIPLPPGVYDITIRKEGFKDWTKTLVIEKEIVTEATANLFRSAPSLTALNFSPTYNTTPSRDFTKLAYIVPPNTETALAADDKGGLWLMEMLNLPLGFSREPKRVTDGDVTDAEIIWSPDGREILLTTELGSFLLNASAFTTEANRVNVTTTLDTILANWEIENETRLKAQVRKLPEELESILTQKVESVILSPDEDMVLYTASSSASIPDELIPQLPGASTQKQERVIVPGSTYVYDIKEDRNFLIDDGEGLMIEGGLSTVKARRISWFPTSRHLVLAEPNKITIMDYDGTNRQEVYSGNYVAAHAYPTLTFERLIILTNLGANSNPPNLYSLGIK